jgi:arylsulfatase A-like enzyme
MRTIGLLGRQVFDVQYRCLIRISPVLLIACTSCTRGDQEQFPTVVFITLDTTRADHLSTYGYERPTDPFLREFSKKGRVFEHAVATATWTLPSHGTLFSGLHPSEHGVWDRDDLPEVENSGKPAIPPSLPLFTTRLAEAGYDLIGAVGGPYASSKYGFGRHFDVYIEGPDQTPLSGQEINASILAELDRRNPDPPLFLFVNYFDAHAPYDPPDRDFWPFPEGVQNLDSVELVESEFASTWPPSDAVVQWAINQYDRELLVQDEALEGLFLELESRGLLESAIVIITSDHGESFGEQGVFGHGGMPHESVSRVPLVVWKSGMESMPRVGVPVSTTSVSATILEELNLPSLPGGRGRNLFGAESDFDETVYSEYHTNNTWVGTVRTIALKYGRTLGPHVTPDVEALINLAANEVQIAISECSAEEKLELDRLRLELRSLIGSWQAEPPDLSSSVITDAERNQLEGLGYTD